MAGNQDVTIYWHPHLEVYPELPPEHDFIAFDEESEDSIGRVHLMKHSEQQGRWCWSMFAHSNTGRVPFETHGHEDSRGEAGRRVVEAYRRLLEHNECHPRKALRSPE